MSYCNEEANVATQIAKTLEGNGVSKWVATQDCRVGDNWRQAQARGVMNASIQVVVIDESIVDAKVLRTEIMLAEAFGLPVVTVLGRSLGQDERAVARVMKQLRSADITFSRLTEVQPFRCDEKSVASLAKWIRTTVPSLSV